MWAIFFTFYFYKMKHIDDKELISYNFNPDKKIRYDLYWNNTHKDKFFTSIHTDEEMIEMILKKHIPHNRVTVVSIFRKDKEGTKKIYNQKRNVIINPTPNPKKHKQPKVKKEREKPRTRFDVEVMPVIDLERSKTDIHYCRRLVLRLFNFHE